MKKLSLVMAVLMIMLSTMGFTTAEKAYWEQNEKIMKWGGIESKQDVSLSFKSPDGMDINYKMDISSKGKIQEMLTYVEINTESVGALADYPKIPQIKLYTKGSNLYINKEAFLAFANMVSGSELDIKEDYIMISNDQGVDISASLMDEMMKFLKEMDLGIDTGMVQEGNKYTVNLDSDKMIDLLDAYMRYIIVNIDKLPAGIVPAEAKMTDEEKQQMIEMYDAFVTPYKDTAKAAIKGSSYKQVDVFEDSKYEQEAAFDVKSPMGNGTLIMKSVSNKVENINISIPTSVKVVTEEELNEMMTPPMPPAPVMISLDGSYKNYKNDTYVEDQIEMKNINGETYMNVKQLSSALSAIIETNDEFIRTTDLKDLGFIVEWDADTRTINIY